MKPFRLVLISLVACLSATAQKKTLDFAAIDNWPELRNEQISDNGTYLLYNIATKDSITLVIQSTSDAQKLVIQGGRDAVFSMDGKQVLYRTSTDSLACIQLSTGDIHLLGKITSFKLLNHENREWVVYQKEDSAKDLVVLDTQSGKEKIYRRTIEYFVPMTEGRILLFQQSSENSVGMDSVSLLDLNTDTVHFIWRGKGARSWVMDSSAAQVAFFKRSTERGGNELWYYKIGLNGAVPLIGDSINATRHVQIQDFGNFFSLDGNVLFYKFRVNPESELTATANQRPDAIVWSYQDKTLNRSLQDDDRPLEAAVNLASGKEVVIEANQGDNSFSWCKSCCGKGKVLLTANRFGEFKERNWRPSARADLFVVSTTDGTRTLLMKDFFPSLDGGISPTGKYILWFDRVRRGWFIYNFETTRTTNISNKINVSFLNDLGEANNEIYYGPYGYAGWLENDTAVLLYDKFDIWAIDPKGINPPRNITLGYGRRHHTVLRSMDPTKSAAGTSKLFASRDTLLLYTFDTASKMTGFAKLPLSHQKGIIPILQRPMRYFSYIGPGLHADPSEPFYLKAKSADAYLFKPSRDTVYPNLSFTTDLTHFRQLSNLEPQKQYNWYTDELLHWNGLDGRMNTGILFKPENFDPKQKYPLIIVIYETFSDNLNIFLRPTLPRGDIETLWYVNHGYLVLLPDIHYTMGYPAESAYNTVVSAAKRISRIPWVDAKRLGLQGHSFGGYEANYIITKTNLFAAASAANAVTDIISESGQLFGSSGCQFFFEAGQGRIGATLWKRPDLYIRESPIFNADKVTTPLLIVHNPQDDAVAFSQATEWFTGLRRLGKKVWMLQYLSETHNINDEENQRDYSNRLETFFDHFLKGTPAPSWMRGE